MQGKIVSSSHEPAAEPVLPESRGREGAARAAVAAAKDDGPAGTQLHKAPLKLPQETKDCPCTGGREGLSQQQGAAELLLPPRSAPEKGSMASSSCSGQGLCQAEGLHPDSGAALGHAAESGLQELEGSPLPLEGKPEAKQGCRKSAPGKSRSCRSPERCGSEPDELGCTESRSKANAKRCFQGQQRSGQVEDRGVPASLGHREEEQQQQQRVTEATVCAKNSKVSSTGEKVVLWTR